MPPERREHAYRQETPMAWQDLLKGDSVTWLLESGTPGISYLALKDLLSLPEDDPALQAAEQQAYREGPVRAVLDAMEAGGYWSEPGPGYNPKYRSTVWAVITLAQLGVSVRGDERISRACNYLASQALTPGGHFSSTGAPSGTADCLQGNLCWALAALGFDLDRLEPAYEWMARSVTGEGVATAGERSAGVRYYAGKCGPGFACGANNRLPCAWGAVKVMLAFARWPVERRSPLVESAIQAGVDFFFSTDPAGATYPCGWSSKPSGNWWKFGFPVFYVTDLLQLVEALASLGYGADPRLASALAIIRDKQDHNGRWALEYDYKGKTWADFGEKKQPNPWVTLRALRVLRAL
ncbi:MAG TPA: hypothetical protein VGA03_01025 [Anaerolineales bacterium]